MNKLWKPSWIWWSLPALIGCASLASAGEVPPWLPRYDLDIQLQVEQHQAIVHERVTWINRHLRPAQELIFNAHSHYKMPDADVALLAKMVELLRNMPSEALDFDGPACDVRKVVLLEPTGPPPVGAEVKAAHWRGKEGEPEPDVELLPPRQVPQEVKDLPFHFQEQNPTALVVSLPRLVGQGEAVTVEVEFVLRLPQKMGRWGQWKGTTFLAQWLPVLAFYDEAGWQPTPFIPWHQPFFNEAGVYHVRLTLPCDQKVACSGSIVASRDLGNGLKELHITACGVRDFSLVASACFQEVTGEAGPVHVRCLAPPEHEYYARVAVQSACTAINAYSQWFGPYLYPEFTIVESYFGWNGNECGGMIMIDHRIFGMPHLAWRYFDGLVAHETCHQWWYNAVGTNGYAETWMDEGLATYFSYHLMQIKYGKNDPLLELPKGLDWLPNIHRDTFTFYGLYGTLGRGDACPTVQDMPKYSHLVNLLSMTYDRGSKVLGMIEDRMGEPAFFAFMATVYGKYQYGMLRVADFQRELEAFTHSSWDEFFRHWVYGAGMTDWCVEKVHVERSPLSLLPDPAPASRGPRERGQGPYRVTVILHQKAQYNEATVLGIRLDHSDDYQIRLPIEPEALPMRIDHPPAVVTLLEDNHFQVEVELPCKPTQIAVDPDQVLLDCNPANNYWKTPIRWRLTPLYTQLEETDLTTDYDRWNVILGPWIYGASYDDPWFTRSARLGLRAGLYRTQDFNGGAYLAFRPDERDLVAGTDGLWDHWPWPHTQVGFVAERGLTHDWHGFPEDRGVLFGRYVFQYGSSLYLPPMKYVEVFTALLEHNLEPAAMTVPGADPFNHQSLAGVHYHVDYLTPYWDPEGGFKFDATYSSGLPILGEREGLNRVDSQFSIVKKVPDGLGFLSETRVAARIYGAAGLPDKGQFYTLGGSTLFRGFDPTDREGNAMWLGSLEWRVPVVRGLECDYVDHTVGLRNVYVAAFYDVGQAFLNGHSLGEVNHALGAGLRMDVAWFSFVERTILRLDVAKAINTNSPWQIWVGVGAPF